MSLPATSDPSPRPRLLLVEDSADVRMIVEMILGTRFDVVAVESAEAALAVCLAQSFDVAVIDLLLPDHDGHWLVNQLRELPGFGAKPAIALTASVFDDDRERARLSGFDVFEAKPLRDIDAFRGRILQLVEGAA